MSLPRQAACQPAKFSPEQPKWGTILTVTYDPKSEVAKLSPRDEIYVAAWLRFPEHTERWHAKMQKIDGRFESEFSVDANLSYVTFYFVTVNAIDSKATLSTLIYRSDGIPARGAYQHSMNSDNYAKIFEKEIALYPDNYAVYQDKWREASFKENANASVMIRKDIEALTREVKGDPVDYLYSLSTGYLLLNEETKSREVLKKMIERAPASELTTNVLARYLAQISEQQIQGAGPEEIEGLKWGIISSYPNNEYARWNSGIAIRQGKLPLAKIEQICQLWMQDEPENPLPYLRLASVYSSQDSNSDKALSLIKQAINYLLRGKLRLYRDYFGQITPLELPWAYHTNAELSLKRQDYAGALASVKAAQALGESDHRLYALEGKIWQELSNYSRAESAYMEAWRLGSKSAEEFLKDSYEKRRGNLVGFEEYLTTKKVVATAIVNKAAPAFTATSLRGKLFDSAALRGKVVVLNFWFIGCMPCRVEMPGLNRLVSDFSGKDVVFLAPTFDGANEVGAFLKEKRFLYQIIPAEKISLLFQVSTYPTHIIINKEGQIYAVLTGGSPRRHELLRPMIERALNQR